MTDGKITDLPLGVKKMTYEEMVKEGFNPPPFMFSSHEEMDKIAAQTTKLFSPDKLGTGVFASNYVPKPIIRFKRLTPTATIPTRGSEHAVGLDIYADQDGEIPGLTQLKISTGVAGAVPKEHCGRISPRSSLAVKNGIIVQAGVIDPDYRGEIFIVLYNSFQDHDHYDATFRFKRGDRIAQLVLQRVSMFDPVEVDDLDETIRGSGGFGSTGR